MVVVVRGRAGRDLENERGVLRSTYDMYFDELVLPFSL